MRSTTRRILQLMLKPALRYSVRNSISIQDLFESVRSVLVALAEEEITKSKSKVTISRISAITGMNRREVTRIYREGVTLESMPNLARRVLNRWEQDDRFLTKSKKPKVLSFKGEDSEFTLLVESVSKDMKPATMLFELERIGAVKRNKNSVRLIHSIMLHRGQSDRGLDLLSRDVETQILAIEENLFAPQNPRNLHLRTEFDNIYKEDLPKIRTWLYKQGALFHKRARDYLSQYDKDVNPDFEKEGGSRVVLGAISWTSENDE